MCNQNESKSVLSTVSTSNVRISKSQFKEKGISLATLLLILRATE